MTRRRPMTVTVRDIAGILALAVGTPLGMAAIIWALTGSLT